MSKIKENQKKEMKRESTTVHEDPLLMTLRAVRSASLTATISDPTTIISTRTEIRTESSEEYSPCPFCWKSFRNKGPAPEPKKLLITAASWRFYNTVAEADGRSQNP